MALFSRQRCDVQLNQEVLNLDHLLGGRRAEVSQRRHRSAAEGEGERKPD